MLATIYQDMAERRRHEQANPTNTLAKLINDLQTRLDDTFVLTKEQKVSSNNGCLVRSYH